MMTPSDTELREATVAMEDTGLLHRVEMEFLPMNRSFREVPWFPEVLCRDRPHPTEDPISVSAQQRTVARLERLDR